MGETPSLHVGVIKERTEPQVKYQPQAAPAAFNGLQQQYVSVTATVDGKDETYTDIPVGAEIAQRGNEILSATREAMLQHVDGMIQASRNALEQVDYHRRVVEEGERMLGVLNPQYAENRRNADAIRSIEDRQSALEKQNAEILDMLRKMAGAGGTKE